MSVLGFHFTERAHEAFSDGLSFGLLVAHAVDSQCLSGVLKPIRKETQRLLAEPSASNVAYNLATFEQYFAANGQVSPLLRQRAHLQKAGIPSSNPILTLLLLAELKTGVLIGIQNASAIESPLAFDVLEDSESFEGMRGKTLCRRGEPVLRDAHGIIASFFQGPDKRTQIEADSREVAAFVFGVPGGEPGAVEEPLQLLESILTPCCHSMERETFLTARSAE